MRHAISVLLQNEVGALTRLTGMFSSRGYNIESLNVAPTDDETVSRVTLVVSGSDAAVAQLNAQLAKLVDVVNIHDMTLGDHFERELAIIKLKLDEDGEASDAARNSRRQRQQFHDAAARPHPRDRQLCRRGRRCRTNLSRCAQWQRCRLERRGTAVVLR